PFTDRGPESRSAASWNLNETLNWQKGKHSFQFGENFTQINLFLTDQNVVPSISFGVDTTNDPANAMFTTGNFPGASTSDLTNARALYALLTGRVTQINGDARLSEATNQYVYAGPGTQRARMNEFGLFAQDSWRLTPTITANLGVRWEV